MVITKLAVLLFFIVVAFSAFNGDHFSDFAPNGFDGIESAAALIFFAYIGFDAVSTAGEETRKPGRDLPIAIVGSLVIAAVIYILVAVAAVGALPADQLAGQDAPLAIALSEGAGIGLRTLFAFFIVNIASSGSGDRSPTWSAASASRSCRSSRSSAPRSASTR
jgi:APA family basic amino acid/polyamine antiporter